MRSGVKILKLLFMVLTMSLPFRVYSSDAATTFLKANASYMEQDYPKAIEQYEQLLSTGQIAAEVYYNLGNSYYKTGDITPAILNYERARRMQPSDTDINHNLRMAYLGTIDKIEPLPKVFYEEWWERIVNEGSVDRRAITAIAILWLLLMGGIIYLFAGKRIIRKVAFLSAMGLLVIYLFMFYLTNLQYHSLNEHRAALIFSESAFVKSSPDDRSANLFMLHSGTRVEILDELRDWKKIRIANGSEGWVMSGNLEVI